MILSRESNSLEKLAKDRKTIRQRKKEEEEKRATVKFGEPEFKKDPRNSFSNKFKHITSSLPKPETMDEEKKRMEEYYERKRKEEEEKRRR